jgi:hypothetical protein
MLTAVVINRGGLNRHQPRDTVRGERDTGRTNRTLCRSLGSELIDVPNEWRLEPRRKRLVFNQAASDLSSTLWRIFDAARLQLRRRHPR